MTVRDQVKGWTMQNEEHYFKDKPPSLRGRDCGYVQFTRHIHHMLRPERQRERERERAGVRGGASL